MANRRELRKNWKQITPELAYIIGVMFGDGYKQSWYISLETNDEDFKDEFIKCCKEQFGFEPKVYIRKGEKMEDWRNGKTYQRKDRFVVRCGSSEVSEYIDEIQNIEWVKNLSKENKIHWLRGYWDSDGSVNASSHQIYFWQKDKQKAQLYKDIVEEVLGIDVTLKKRKNQDTHYCYFGRQENIKNFIETIQPTIQRKVKKIKQVYS